MTFEKVNKGKRLRIKVYGEYLCRVSQGYAEQLILNVDYQNLLDWAKENINLLKISVYGEVEKRISALSGHINALDIIEIAACRSLLYKGLDYISKITSYRYQIGEAVYYNESRLPIVHKLKVILKHTESYNCRTYSLEELGWFINGQYIKDKNHKIFYCLEKELYATYNEALSVNNRQMKYIFR